MTAIRGARVPARVAARVGALALAIALAAAATSVDAPAWAMMGATQPKASTALIDGEAAAKAGRYKEAIDLLTTAVQEDPRNADAYNYLGFSYRNLGQTDNAAAMYRQALELDPNHKPALEYYGELFLTLKDLKGAQTQLARLVELCPKRCAERGELERAIAAYRAANPGS
jgi:Flp pilus assembly protein TadD